MPINMNTILPEYYRGIQIKTKIFLWYQSITTKRQLSLNFFSVLSILQTPSLHQYHGYCASPISSTANSTVSQSHNASSNSQNLTLKLTQTNYLTWKAVVLPYFLNHNLFGYLDGITPAPRFLAASTPSSSADSDVKTEYTLWFQQDQLILSTLLSTLTELLLPHVGCPPLVKYGSH